MLIQALRLVVLAGCAGLSIEEGQLAEAPVQLSLSVEEVALPGSEGGLWPRISSVPGGVQVAWTVPTELGHELRSAQAAVAGEGLEWTAARQVAEGASWFVNWADFPALEGDARKLATWLERVGEGYAYHVRYALSLDGSSWSRAERLHDDETAAEHGFVSVAELPGAGDGFLAVWLDGRAMASTHGEQVEHAHGQAGGGMALRARRISGETARGPEILLDERVCECCQTDAVALADGSVVVAYRDRSDDEVRDIALVRGHPLRPEERWSKPSIPFADHWTMPACPVNGPALDAHGQQVALAWFTAGTGQPLELGDFGTPRSQVAFSQDGGQSFGSALELDDMESGASSGGGRVDVVFLNADTALVSFFDATRELWWARGFQRGPDGWLAGSSVRISSAPGGRSAGFLRLGRIDEFRALAVWTAIDPETTAPGGLKAALLRYDV